MNNIMNYLDWRGDLSFAQDSLNEVDNLILSTLSYIEFDGIVPFERQEGSAVLSEIAQAAYDVIDFEDPRTRNPFFEHIPDLLLKAAATRRFGGLRLSCYINRLNYDTSEQFSAIVFTLHEGLHYIAFRGTDDNLIGWKEDFQMSFLDETQSQRDAVEYVRYLLGDLEGKVYLGGHSKGGNLAVYVAASIEELQHRILAVYSNDGPGFQEKFLASQGYRNILPRIHSFLPKSSVVGMLMEHLEEYVVVNSNERGIMQHNAFSWEVLGRQFVYQSGVKKSSIFLNQAIRQWLNNVTLEERADFVERLFEILQASGLNTVSGITSERRIAVNGMIKAYHNMSPETKAFMKKIIHKFIAEGQKVIMQSIEEELLPGVLPMEKTGTKRRTKGYIKLNS
ncbi:hypothetical protein HNQ56_002740 [Anaerotaenia torta]|uniref:DUF2974 domain-containing protein n=1 Tax=Anaerotaenia torta TaxID=433293 RepID=UPI003D23572B